MNRRWIPGLVIIFLVWPTWTQAAALFFSPNRGTFTVGQSLTVSVGVNAAGQPVNSAGGTVSFPTDLLQFQGISRDSSIFSLWPFEPSGSNSTGQISFSGGLIGSQYSGSDGTVVTMAFKALAAGTAQLKILDGRVLANDGQGTNLLTASGAASLTLTTSPVTALDSPAVSSRPVPELSSSTHPDSQDWYRELEASFNYSQPTGLEGVSFILTQQSGSIPDELQDPADGPLLISIPDEGVWYFHLRGLYPDGWSSPAHFRLQIDRSPPEPFAISLNRDQGDEDATPGLEFSTSDGLSGLAEYRMALNAGEEEAVESPLTLTLSRGGRQRVSILAIDRAGNQATQSVAFDFNGRPPPQISTVTRKLMLLESMMVRGVAQAGDKIEIFIDGSPIGEVTAGQSVDNAGPDVVIRVPWEFTSGRLFRPGTYKLTATATSPSGLVSVPTDPIEVRVSGSTIALGGGPVLVVAAVPAAAALILLGMVINVWVFVRLWAAVRAMRRRDRMVDRELQALEDQVQRGQFSLDQVAANLEQIERDLAGSDRPRRSRKRP